MMSLPKLLKKISSIKAETLKRADYDKKNISDDIRGVKASEVYKRIQRTMRSVIRVDYDMVQDTDANLQASLEVGALNFTALAKSAAGNLLTLTISKIASLVAAVDEIQNIAFSAVPDDGDWSLTFSGQTTSTLAFNAAAMDVQNALNALSNLSGVTVAGDYTAGFDVTFAGADGGTDQPLLVEASNTLLASAVPVTTMITESVAGVSPVDTRDVRVIDNHVIVECIAAATNTEVKAQMDASSQVASLMTVSIDAGQGAVAATAAVSAQFSGGI